MCKEKGLVYQKIVYNIFTFALYTLCLHLPQEMLNIFVDYQMESGDHTMFIRELSCILKKRALYDTSQLVNNIAKH